MKGLYNIVKRKKGVSPVIAVVLLIALTVAAAAVIWAITQGLIGGVVSITIQTTDTSLNAGDLVWQGTVEASEGGTISFAIFNSTHTMTATGSFANLVSGSEQSYTVTFSHVAGAVVSGQYTLEVTLDVDGEDSIETTKISA